MKLFLAFSTIALFCFFACGRLSKNEPNTPTNTAGIHYEDSPFVWDTTKTNYIDSICFATNKAMFHKPKLNHLDVSHFSQPNLKIGYYTNPESGITRILISENENRVLNIRYIFYKNDMPIQMHYRYWDKNLNPQYVEETYMYFDEGGEMFYAGERKTELFDGEIPAKLKSIELAIPEKSKKELYDFFLKYWEMSKPLVDQHMAAEAAANSGQ